MDPTEVLLIEVDMLDPDGPSPEGTSSHEAVRVGTAQVDVCPGDAGFILSVGRVSVWLNLSDALDVAQALARALERQVTDDSTKPAEQPAAGERSIASILLPVKS